MRWIWLDRILALERGERCVAIKNVTAAEEVLHDHFPATDPGVEPARPPIPVMPNTLIIEGMAQTAGILVGHAAEFQHKVLLAKISRATFSDTARPGHTIRHSANLDYLDERGGSTSGTSELIDSATGDPTPLASINLMFSHIDQNRGGLDFPDENFVFTDQFKDLLRRSGVE